MASSFLLSRLPLTASISPGIRTIILTVIVFYLLGDGLNHVLNPKYSFDKGGK